MFLDSEAAEELQHIQFTLVPFVDNRKVIPRISELYFSQCLSASQDDPVTRLEVPNFLKAPSWHVERKHVTSGQNNKTVCKNDAALARLLSATLGPPDKKNFCLET